MVITHRTPNLLVFGLLALSLVTTSCSAGSGTGEPVQMTPGMNAGTVNAVTAGTSATFVLTASMNTARKLHTSTLLTTGQVLVTGGVDINGNAIANAEIFNPNIGKGKWRAAGSMSVGRVFHTATLLPNGKVLVAGGAPALNGNCVASAELFDPSTAQWTATGSMAQRRCSHTATLLADGEVLVAGGDVDGVNSLVSSEIFNPATGTWQPTGNLNQARANHLSALLQNGKVLVAAGRDFVNGSFTDLASAELFDPSHGTWSFTGSLSRADGTPFGSPLANGDVLAARVAFFTPSSGTWTNTGASPPNLGLGTTATLLTTGEVLLTGFTEFCDGCGFNPVNAALLYEPSTNSYVSTSSMNASRIDDSAVRLANGEVLVSGGENRAFQILSSAELYSP